MCVLGYACMSIWPYTASTNGVTATVVGDGGVADETMALMVNHEHAQRQAYRKDHGNPSPASHMAQGRPNMHLVSDGRKYQRTSSQSLQTYRTGRLVSAVIPGVMGNWDKLTFYSESSTNVSMAVFACVASFLSTDFWCNYHTRGLSFSCFTIG